MFKKQILTVMTLLLTPGIAHAEPRSAQTCKDTASVYWDTGITSKMMEGNQVYMDCMLQVIEHGLDSIMPDTASRDEVLEEIKNSAESAWKARSMIDNENKWCNHGCGTMYLVTPASSAFRILEAFDEEIQNKVSD